MLNARHGREFRRFLSMTIDDEVRRATQLLEALIQAIGMSLEEVEQRLEETYSRDRAAWFTCALAVAWPDGPAVVVEGRIDGSLTFPPRGDRGFGYDPIFIPEGGKLTFGEMDPAEKDAISHRARAFAKLKAALL